MRRGGDKELAAGLDGRLFRRRWKVKGSIYIGTGMSRLGNSVWLHQKPLYCLLDKGFSIPYLFFMMICEGTQTKHEA